MKNKISNINKFFKPFIHIENINEDSFYFDLHLHTIDSDSLIQPKELADFLHKKNYLVAITDHNSIGGVIELLKYGINAVPGIELGCSDGMELLVYFKNLDDCKEFYNLYVLPYRHSTRMSRTTKDIWFYFSCLKKYEVYTSIPHISGIAQKNFIKNKPEIFQIIKMVNAVEINNYSLSKRKNNVAKNIKLTYHLEGTYGSDAHSIKEVFSFYRYLNKKHNYLHKGVDYIYKVSVATQIGYKHFKYMLFNKFWLEVSNEIF